MVPPWPCLVRVTNAPRAPSAVLAPRRLVTVQEYRERIGRRIEAGVFQHLADAAAVVAAVRGSRSAQAL